MLQCFVLVCHESAAPGGVRDGHWGQFEVHWPELLFPNLFPSFPSDWLSYERAGHKNMGGREVDWGGKEGWGDVVFGGTQDFWASQFHQHTCFWLDFYLIFVCLDHWDCLFKKCLNAKNLVICGAIDVFKSFLILITSERPVCNPHILCIGQKSEIRSESGICRLPTFGKYYKLSLSWGNSYLDLILLESHFA